MQGQVKDDEIYGKGNVYAYKYRMEDARIIRFFSPDPLHWKYSYNSDYAFSENKLTNSLELEGLEAVDLMTGVKIDMGNQTELKVLKSNDYALWRDMLQFEMSSSYKAVFENYQKSKNLSKQSMSSAGGEELNTDYYAVTINKLPTGMSESGLYNYIKQNLGKFLDASIAEFRPDEKQDATTFSSSNPTGAVMVFDNLMDDAAVLVTQSSTSSNYWVFTPVTNSSDGQHPLAGHRELGLSKNENGSYTFYTRGVDRMYGVADRMYNGLSKGGKFFGQADKLWNGLMNKVSEFINNNGGQSEKTHNFNRRINWQKDVKKNDKEG
jgi:hypothetical protein